MILLVSKQIVYVYMYGLLYVVYDWLVWFSKNHVCVQLHYDPREPKSTAQALRWGWPALAGAQAEPKCYDI
jgi:hypothetical protein